MASGSFELYLIRHAIAEQRGEKWPDDNKRPLTEDGIARMRRASRGLARLVSFDAVLTSPLVRARQTAEIVAAACDPKPALVNVESLTPDGNYAAIVADLEKHARKAMRLALVSHEPLIGELAARLIGSRHPIEFKKGAVCRIDLDSIPPAGPGDLRWMATPKILRLMNK